MSNTTEEYCTLCVYCVICPPNAKSDLLLIAVQAFLEATPGNVPGVSYTLCDVRDIAKAHVLAAETASASGRYIVSDAKRMDAHDITDILKVGLHKGRLCPL